MMISVGLRCVYGSCSFCSAGREIGTTPRRSRPVSKSNGIVTTDMFHLLQKTPMGTLNSSTGVDCQV